MVRGVWFRYAPAMVLALTATISGRADSVLEQMQNEVAALAKHTKSAVVSVEDERILTSSASAPVSESA